MPIDPKCSSLCDCSLLLDFDSRWLTTSLRLLIDSFPVVIVQSSMATCQNNSLDRSTEIDGFPCMKMQLAGEIPL
jgi:hypothetical protein